MKNYISNSNVYKTKDDYDKYSVSKIKTYKECSQMYKLKYIDKVDEYKSSTATCIGTLLHATLEYLYGTEDDTVVTAEDAFFNILIPEFKSMGISDAESILGDLLEYNNDISFLYTRASADYTGPDAIRTGKGLVPKAPEMTGVWKQACRDLNLDSRKNRIDKVIQDSYTKLSTVSITEVYSKSYNFVKNYTTPFEIEEVLYLELPLSHWDKTENLLRNPVPFPFSKLENIYLNGYVDNISKIKLSNGKVVNCVIDYKTSKEEFNENIVAHNQQLLTYAKGVEILLDIPIDYIGILSITHKELIYVPVNRELQEDILENYNNIINSANKGTFIKHVPDTKYAPCLNSFGGTCSFLKHCWPKSHEYLENGRNIPSYSDYFS